MTGHQLTSVLMTALVLSCPFLGCGECCGMSPDQHVLASGCEHAYDTCGDCDSKLPSDHNCPHSDEVADCFCEGAVLPDSTTHLELDVVSAFHGFVSVDSRTTLQLVALKGQDESLSHGSHFPPLLSGRDICTLVEIHLL